MVLREKWSAAWTGFGGCHSPADRQRAIARTRSGLARRHGRLAAGAEYCGAGAASSSAGAAIPGSPDLSRAAAHHGQARATGLLRATDSFQCPGHARRSNREQPCRHGFGIAGPGDPRIVLRPTYLRHPRHYLSHPSRTAACAAVVTSTAKAWLPPG